LCQPRLLACFPDNLAEGPHFCSTVSRSRPTHLLDRFIALFASKIFDHRHWFRHDFGHHSFFSRCAFTLARDLIKAADSQIVKIVRTENDDYGLDFPQANPA
jgi:hypothetical protein